MVGKSESQQGTQEPSDHTLCRQNGQHLNNKALGGVGTQQGTERVGQIERVALKHTHCCCCCCYVASVVSNSVRPHRRQPTRLPRPCNSPGKNTRVGCHFLLQCMKVKSEVKSLSHVRLFATPWTAAYQAPLPMGFSRQEYWSGSPVSSPNNTVKQHKTKETSRKFCITQ